MVYLSATTIRKLIPEPPQVDRAGALEHARRAMQDTGCWSQQQQMGRRWTIGCVALEITQRCNLDCTLCYLSEYSEAVQDIPLDEIFRRIDLIQQYYGENTDVQVTGGDPTLRKQDELIAIIRHIRTRGLRATLMTNGILATRKLLTDLAAAGLNDVAFHVDTTQNRKGYHSEMELNHIRTDYLHRTAGLGLSVMFNTTVHKDNFHEIPDLIRYFIEQAQSIRTVSFQLQADTGRGIERGRASFITPEKVWRQIETGAGTSLNHTAIQTGHSGCNRYAMGLVANRKLFDLFDDTDFIGQLHEATATLTADRQHPWLTARQFGLWLLTHPDWLIPLLRWTLRKLHHLGKDLWQTPARITTLSFFVHNFMHACALEPERIQACVFKTITSEGPLSMCVLNAKRDEVILKPVPLNRDQLTHYWDPLSGRITDQAGTASVKPLHYYPLKKLKGRSRANYLKGDRV